MAPPISSDPPFHQIARRLMLPPFAPRKIEALQGYTEELCASLLDALGDRTDVDGAIDYAQHIPVALIAKMVGLPPEDGDLFRGFVHTILEGVDLPVEERQVAFEPIEAYIIALIEDHVANPRDDLVTYLLDAEIEGNKLLPEHIFGTIALLIVAGIDTTWSAIGASIWHLATHPEDRARLVAEPELLDTAVEEFLRAYAPVTMARLVIDDFEFEGCPMKRDDWLLLSFPAANRDPEVFERADEVLIDRQVNRHAAFGLGIHRCLGSNLARMELRVALQAWLDRYPNFELDPTGEVTWSQGQVRGPRQLPLRIVG